MHCVEGYCSTHCLKQRLIRRCMDATYVTDGLTQDVTTVGSESYVSQRAQHRETSRSGFDRTRVRK